MWRDEHVGDRVVGEPDACVLFADFAVVAGANAFLVAELAVPGFGANAVDDFGFVFAADDFGDDVVLIEKCVVGHGYQLINPVPSVNS